MGARTALVEPTEAWGYSLSISVVVSLGYTGLVLGYVYFLSSSVSIHGPAWWAILWYSIMGFGTVGTPILLWLQFNLRSPAVLLACILVFCHTLPLWNTQGDTSGFFLVFYLMPFYLVAYALLAGGEYWI
ncbi:hypothetical protein PNP85_13450 [Halobacterium salinarum]|uniref:hypothetical protein n=1 Tax=Halobacterium TaxID=2239 RepID=UPI001E36494D|nr:MULTISPECIES: hypothetical protein [Halobacterium]MCD2201714.1 hypothetical protein [Halobacterium sp. KA-4]MDL0136551.1 hypothetical protein [Halobacterium salinarum]MDL0140509.1 hypothetical protein [Halobacterium salinarum]